MAAGRNADQRLWIAPLATTALSLAPIPLLAQRYRLFPDFIASAAVVVAVSLAVAGVLFRGRITIHAVLWGSVVLVLALDVFGVAALLRIIEQTGSDVRGGSLLLSAIQTWLANVAAFALLYWFLNEVLRRDGEPPSFLFPEAGAEGARHGIVDYIFVAVTMALAFGPTDTPPATTSARCAVMVQAVISFIIVALVAARAINAIG